MNKNWIKGSVVLDVESLQDVLRDMVREVVLEELGREGVAGAKSSTVQERRMPQPRERRTEDAEARQTDLVQPKRRDDDRQFSARIRAARKARGWNRRDLATAVGIGRKSIINIESGLYPVGMKVRRRLEEVLLSSGASSASRTASKSDGNHGKESLSATDVSSQ
ncbi:MAG: helix-turn-helix transcriptional regulator [Magnetococcales bacterium]|nr:helix-turn-helix transcriptional regulator [Magnetococcales bacterium]